MTTGNVIILNGASASGKSSIQKKVQELFDEPYLSVGIDGFFDQLIPDEHGLNGTMPKGNFDVSDIRYVEEVEVDGKPSVKLYIGPLGRKIVSGMHNAIAAYAKAGNNLVVDYILYDENWLPELVRSLHGIPTYYIGINYPIEVIESREAKRSTSPVGHARSHYKDVHCYSNYDLLIEDHTLSAEDIAIKIKDFVANNEPNAFEEYYQLFND